MIGSFDLKARVEEDVGAEVDLDVFAQAEQNARQKLDRINDRAGRQYGEDGYGDEYLVILAVEAVREMAFSAWCEIKSAANMADRAAGKVVETCLIRFFLPWTA